MRKTGLIQEDATTKIEAVDRKALINDIKAVKSKKELDLVVFKFIKSLKGSSLLLTNQFKARDESTEFGLKLKGKKTREKINNQIKEIVESVKASEDLTDDQRKLLKQYSGNGGLTNNSLFEYYTPTFIAGGMWELMKENGFENGNVLDSSTGAGVFSATKLPGTLITGAEIDPTSSKVNQLLHPEDQINNQPFENLCLQTPDNSFDSVIGNVPFGNSRGRYQWIDKQYDDVTKIEYYFIHRSIDKCKPGGIICLVCPTGVLNNKSKKDIQFRQQISKKAEFLGAHKLPSKTFYDQGTPVVTDILVFKKHPENLLKNVEDYEYKTLEEAKVYYEDFIQGTYWKGEGQKFIHGKLSHSSFRNSEIVDSDIDDQTLKKKLAVKFNSRINWELLEISEPELKSYIEGDRKYINSKEYEFITGSWQEVEKEADEIISLESEKYGCSNLAELKSLLAGNIEGALELSFIQAYNTMLAFPDILTPLQKEAISVAQESKFPEEIYKGIIMGGMVGKLQYKMAEGHDDIDVYRAIVQNTITNSLDKSNLPFNNKKLLKEGASSKAFGMYASAVKNDGSFSDLLSGTLEKDKLQYDPTSLEAIVTHLYERESILDISLEDIRKLYTGNKALNSLSDLASERNLAITPDGYIEPLQRFISGDIYSKIDDLILTIGQETDPKLKSKFQEELEEIKKNRKVTAVEDISFTLNQKWIPKKYIIDFLKTTDEHSEMGLEYGEDIKEEHKDPYTDEMKTVTVFKKDLDAIFGYYRINRYKQGFNNQLIKYLNGKKAGGKRAKDKETGEEIDNKKIYNEKIAKLNEEFQEYMESHPNVLEVQELFNRKFNSYKEFDYSSDPLDLSGVSSGKIKLHGYQAQAVRRLSEEGRGILGFDVGLGKSFTALGLYAENLKKGRAKRTCIVVPNAVLSNWYHESKKFLGDLSKALCVGFSVKKDKTGKEITEPVLDSEGNQVTTTNEQGVIEKEYQDVLVLDSSEEKFKKAHSIPQSDYSLVIMTKEFFKTLPLRPETKGAFLDKHLEKGRISEKLADNAAGAKKGRSYKEALGDEIKANQLSKDFDRKDELPYYEDMGFDSVIVDEAHEFKNSFEPKEMQGIAYLSTAPASQRAIDMNIKLDHLKEMNGGRGPVMLTATPVTNSPFEVYNMVSMVAPAEEMEKFGIYTVDDFINVFGKIEMVDKLKTTGEIATQEGLTGFKQLDGLRSLFNKYTNLKKAADITGFELPPHEEIQEVVELTIHQQNIYDLLKTEAVEASKPMNQRVAGARHLFAILRDMDKITTDPDLYLKEMTFIYPISEKKNIDKAISSLPKEIIIKETEWDSEKNKPVKINTPIILEEELKLKEEGDNYIVVIPDIYESSLIKAHVKYSINEDLITHPLTPKYAKLIDNIKKEHESKGKQLIFTEEKTQHNKIKRIISKNIPLNKNKVAIINADTAAGDKIQDISDEYNKGNYRIVIANKKAEVGVNLQKGTSAIHHLTYPWTPASIQQRNGRGLRQGNKASHINIYYYNGKRSIDEYRLDVLKSKSSWINDLLTGENSEVINGDADDTNDIEILMSDNPEEARRRKEKQRAEALKREEEKVKRSLFNTLKQVAILGKELKDFDQIKEQQKKELEEKVSKLTNFIQNNENSKNLSKAKFNLNRAEQELKYLDSRSEITRKEKETRLRTLKGVLKKKKNILPFDISLVDHADTAAITKSGLIIKKDSIYEFKKWGTTNLIKITDVENVAKAFKYEIVIGDIPYLSSIEVNNTYWKSAESFASLEPVEVSYSEEELSLKKILSESINYYEIHKKLSKEIFAANMNNITIKRGAGFIYQDGGHFAFTSTISENKDSIVYPEPEKNEFKVAAFKCYLETKKNGKSLYYLNDILFHLFGQNYMEEAAEYGNKLSESEILNVLSEQWERKKEDIEDRIYGEEESISYICSGLEGRLLQAVFSRADNTESEIKPIVSSFVSTLRETYKKRLEEFKKQEELEKLKKLKQNPNYKEIPQKVVDAFIDINIIVRVNTEVVGRGYNRFIPFAGWFLQSTDGYRGILRKEKEELKKRWDAKYIKDSGSFEGSWWAIPSENNLEEIYQYLAERA